MSERLVEFAINAWQGPFATQDIAQAAEALENGKVVYCPHLPFSLQEDEKRYLTADITDPKAKNVRYNIHNNELGGTTLPPIDQAGLQEMMRRFADNSRLLVEQLFPHYRGHLTQARTSFRPVEAMGRSSSYRKDDTRLHVDAFPATPTAGKRILRVFSNVNPQGVPRHWRVGEPFSQVVEHFLPQLPKPNWLAAKVLQLIHLTRGERTPYDHYMHYLHNAMKADLEYQKNASQENVYFSPGSTWLVYSDQVSHAAMSGQFMFEQTFYLPIKNMVDEQRAPLRILERATGRALL
jgi:hypothetical protein